MRAIVILLAVLAVWAAPKPDSCTNCKVVSFRRDVLAPLQDSCLACHYDQSQTPGLDLSAGAAYANLVNRKSALNPQMVLVKPSSVAGSFLMDKLSAKPKVGGSMPPYGRPLTPAEKKLIAEWIQQGAKDN
jgi:hypothetical protein